MGGGDCLRGIFWCSGLHDRGKDEGVSRRDAAARGCPDEGVGGETVAEEAPAARGCLIEQLRRLCLGELPLRGAAGLRGWGGGGGGGLAMYRE